MKKCVWFSVLGLMALTLCSCSDQLKNDEDVPIENNTTAKSVKTYEIKGGDFLFGGPNSYVQCTLIGWTGTAEIDDENNADYFLKSDSDSESFFIHIQRYKGMPMPQILGDYFKGYVKCKDDELKLVDEKYLTDDELVAQKTFSYVSDDSVYHEDCAINGGSFVIDFIYSGNKGPGYKYYQETISTISYARASSSSSQKVSSDPKDTISSFIRSYSNKSYDNTSISKISINDDAGTGDGYIALVYYSWSVKNSADTTKKMLKMYSDDLAATLANEYSSINEITVFWEVPYLEGSGKWAYSCSDGKAYVSDEITDF